MFYTHDHIAYGPEGSNTLIQLGSYDEARRLYGNEERGLSNEEFARFIVVAARPASGPASVIAYTPTAAPVSMPAVVSPAPYSPPAGLPRVGSAPLTPDYAGPVYTALPPIQTAPAWEPPGYVSPLVPRDSFPAPSVTAPLQTWLGNYLPMPAPTTTQAAGSMPAIPGWMLYAGGALVLLLILFLRD